MTVPRKQLIYNLLPCKSHCVPPLAFKFSLSKIHPITISSPDVCAETDYYDLVDATGRAIVAGKTGSILANLPPILRY